jgi:tetratricopeptide (TPR) repeat protein
MDIASAFMIYVTLFRLAIIAAGVVSIVLGYRLFARAVWRADGSDQGTTLNANIAGSGFTLKNAAPGTFFALFGVLVISIMFAKGSPEFTLEMLKNAALTEGKAEPEPAISRLVLRGQDSTLQSFTQKGIEAERQRDTTGAMAAYQEALLLMATPMNHLAWLYQQHGRLDEALPLAQLAVQFTSEKAEFLDTLAVTLCKSGKYSEALPVMEKAARLQPSRFRDRLQKFTQDSCQ